MAPDAMDCEELERLKGDDYLPAVHQGRRVLPEETAASQAWIENEDAERFGGDSATNSPGENRRLLSPTILPPPKHKSRLQAGLTLGVSNAPKKQAKYLQTSKCVKARQKTKFEKRKEKLIAILKPPYFIVSMIFFIVCLHIWLPKSIRQYLEWTPGAWWVEPWRLITYGFVHASAAHLALNAVVALAVGWRLEREQGWWRVVVVWGGGVAAGALGAGALQPSVRVVGSSAAVYALLTAHLPNVCLRLKTLSSPHTRHHQANKRTDSSGSGAGLPQADLTSTLRSRICCSVKTLPANTNNHGSKQPDDIINSSTLRWDLPTTMTPADEKQNFATDNTHHNTAIGPVTGLLQAGLTSELRSH